MHKIRHNKHKIIHIMYLLCYGMSSQKAALTLILHLNAEDQPYPSDTSYATRFNRIYYLPHSVFKLRSLQGLATVKLEQNTENLLGWKQCVSMT